MRYSKHVEGIPESKSYEPHNTHDAQFSYDCEYMGETYENMNQGSRVLIADDQREHHRLTLLPKAIDSTKLVERRDHVARSFDTRNLRGFDRD